jgi:hypothetical protein
MKKMPLRVHAFPEHAFPAAVVRSSTLLAVPLDFASPPALLPLFTLPLTPPPLVCFCAGLSAQLERGAHAPGPCSDPSASQHHRWPCGGAGRARLPGLPASPARRRGGEAGCAFCSQCRCAPCSQCCSPGCAMRSWSVSLEQEPRRGGGLAQVCCARCFRVLL